MDTQKMENEKSVLELKKASLEDFTNLTKSEQLQKMRYGEWPNEIVDQHNEMTSELEFYREFLRFRSFDEEIPENCDNVQVLDDDVVYDSYLISIWLFYRVDDNCYSLPVTPETMSGKGFTGWRETPGDLIKKWNEVNMVK